MDLELVAVRAPMELRQEIELLKDELHKKQIDLIEKIHSTRLGKLLEKQLQEVKEFCRLRDAEELKLKKTHHMNFNLTQDAHINSVTNHQMMKLDDKNLGKLKALKQHMMEQRRRLIVKQLEARNKERLLRESWFEEAKAAKLAANFDELPLSETGFCLEEFIYLEGGKVGDGSGSELVSSGPLSQQCGDAIMIGSIECHDRGDTNISANYRDEGGARMLMESKASGRCSSSLNATEFILPAKTYWGILGITADGIKSGTHLDTTIMQSLSSSTIGAPNELDRVPTNSGVIARVEINREPEASHSPLDSTSAQVSMLDAIDNNLQETDRFNIALETETPFPFSVNKVAVNELDTILTKSQVVAGVDLSLKQSIPPPTNDMAAAVDGIARTDTSLEIAAGVVNPLQSKTPPPSTARNVALNKVDARNTNSEVIAGVNMVIERESQPPVTDINAAAGADNSDAVKAFLGPSYEVDHELDGMPMSSEKAAAGIELNNETETQDSPPNTINMKVAELVGMNKNKGPTAGIDCLRCQHAYSNCEWSIFSSVESQIVLTSLAVQYPSTIKQAAVDELDARRGNSEILSSPSSDTNSVVVNKLNVIGTVSGMPLECDNELDGTLTNSEAIARVEMTMEIENPPFPPNAINSGANVLVGMDENVWPTVGVDSQQHQSTYSDYGYMVIPPIQSQIELPSFSDVSTLGNVITNDQVHCPPCTAVDFAMVGPQNTHLLITEQEPSNKMDYSTRCTEIPIQQPTWSTFMQLEPSNQPSLQSSLQPMALHTNMTPGNTCSGELTSTVLSSSPRLTQPEHFPLPQLMNPQIFHPDPFENALMQISTQNESLAQEHENEKKQFRLDYEREMQAIRRKYDALLQDIEAKHLEGKKTFQTIKDKLHKNLVFAKDLREKFMDDSGGISLASHGANFGQYIPQLLQHQLTPRLTSTSTLTPTPASPMSATILPAPVLPPSSSMRLQAPTPAAKTSTPTTAARTALPVQGFRYSSTRPSQRVNYTSAFVLCDVSRPPAQPNLQVGRELRAPAPHLRLSWCRQPPSVPSHGLQTGSSLKQQETPAAPFANSHSCPPNVHTSRALTCDTELERSLG